MKGRVHARCELAQRRGGELTMRSLLAFVALLFLTDPTWAGQSGREFLELCDQGDSWSEGYCVGYVAGAGEMLDGLLLEDSVRAAFDGKIFCLPENVTKGTVRDRVLEFLREHPDITDLEMTSITWAALIEIYPCD